MLLECGGDLLLQLLRRLKGEGERVESTLCMLGRSLPELVDVLLQDWGGGRVSGGLLMVDECKAVRWPLTS